MKNYPVFLLLLCMSAGLKAQTDTVTAKINKLPYKKVDVPARFSSGDFSKYIASNIDYEKRFDRNIHGQVIVAMMVDSTGKVAEVNVLKSMFADIDKQVVHVIKTSPRWSPAILKGKPVSMYMVFNIDMGIRGTPPAATAPLKTPVGNPAIVSKPLSSPVKNKPPVDNKPLPVVKASVPIIVYKPVLKAVKKPVPPFDKKPATVVSKKSLPVHVVAKKITPAVVLKPLSPPPVIAKKPRQRAVVKPAPPPLVAKTVTPTAPKKPVPLLPVITKKVMLPAPKKPVPTPMVAKKVVPPVEKKPTPPPVTAKKVVPPVEKKPVVPPPAVAKKVVPPVTNKPIAPAAIKSVPKKKTLVKIKPKTTPADQNISSLGRSADAEFPNGGLNAFFRYLNQNIRYPVLSKINKVEGVVTLTFVVDMEGTVTDVKVTSTPSDDLAEEATRVLLASPKWRPAMQNGRVINRTFTVPIDFKLSDKQKQ